MRRSIMSTALAAMVVAAAGLGTTAGAADAQALGIPLGLDVRGEYAFPVGDFSNMADPGAGFSIGLSVGVLPGVGVYGSYSQVRFGGGWTGDTVSDATDSGFAVGVSAALFQSPWVIPWIGGGLLFHDLEVNGSSQGISTDLGFELGGGVMIPLTGQLRLSPAINYRHYGATFGPELANLGGNLTVQYLSLGLGLNLTF